MWKEIKVPLRMPSGNSVRFPPYVWIKICFIKKINMSLIGRCIQSNTSRNLKWKEYHVHRCCRNKNCSKSPDTVLNINPNIRSYCGLLFVWSFSSHSRFFTGLKTSPLPVKGCKFLPMLGTYGHWVVRVL